MASLLDVISICVTGAGVITGRELEQLFARRSGSLSFSSRVCTAHVLTIARVLATRAPVRQGLIVRSSSLDLNNSFTHWSAQLYKKNSLHLKCLQFKYSHFPKLKKVFLGDK